MAVARLPIAEKLSPKLTARTLTASVRQHFYPQYNAPSSRLRELLTSTGNDDSLTGNKMFDRYDAVKLLQKAGKDASDMVIADAMPGDIYKKIVHLMKHDHGISQRVRRQEYRRLQRAAE